MRKILTATALASLACTGAIAQQIPINSIPVNVGGFAYPTTPGDWGEYRAVGFAQPLGAGNATNKPRLYLLPLLSVPQNGVRFVNNSGQTYEPYNCASAPAKTITVTVKVSTALPTEVQKVAVGAALSDTKAEQYVAPWPIAPSGMPVMYAPAMTWPDAVTAIQTAHAAHKAETDRQKAFVDRYGAYQTSVAVLNELKLDLKVDGDVVATATAPGTTVAVNGATMSLTVRDPDTYMCNRFVERGFEVTANYRFSDTATSLISARFDAVQTLNQFVVETQKAVTKSKSSGWQVFHIGSRRSKIKSSLEQSMKSDTKIEEMKGTSIVMFDATDDMVARFENAFFPEIPKGEAISSHLAAADAAAAAGKPDLADAHRKYAEALQSGNQMAEVDAVGAAAALNEGDYATFIAKGVRASSSSNVSANTFRRTIDVNVEITKVNEWNEAKSVTAQRQSSTPVTLDTKVNYRGALGLYGGVPYSFQFIAGSPYAPSVENRQGLFVAGLHPNGALANAGFAPGMIITSIDGRTPTSMNDIQNLLDDLSPGTNILVKTLMTPGAPPGPMNPLILGQEQTHNVRVGRAPVAAQND